MSAIRCPQKSTAASKFSTGTKNSTSTGKIFYVKLCAQQGCHRFHLELVSRGIVVPPTTSSDLAEKHLQMVLSALEACYHASVSSPMMRMKSHVALVPLNAGIWRSPRKWSRPVGTEDDIV
ncbi:hypothetical protein PoB_001140000 [Plakobranchus ocellatus]|uniref:Uncharacterized protein n=1 Tax=Plakobranchus ocellatus TaxID=259542 RepID=A0AAV3YR28_9GAST|nr:hypothetical protein PoB_001140000 [Plakobranchus ocellatus]